MLDQTIKEISEYLKESIPLNDVFIYDDTTDVGFCGITDSIKNYAYLRGKRDAKNYKHDFKPGCEDGKVTANFVLIVDLQKKIDKYKAHRLIANKINRIVSPRVNVKTSGDDSDSIYTQETGEKRIWKDCNSYLLCFELEIKEEITNCIKDDDCLDIE